METGFSSTIEEGGAGVDDVEGVTSGRGTPVDLPEKFTVWALRTKRERALVTISAMENEFFLRIMVCSEEA
jgi:hypothetical protein